ncbi:MAG: type I restriction-modification system subunit M [Bacilli bacterium]|nr:type I restriction-modification system subunit M [Bacilli bacterium]
MNKQQLASKIWESANKMRSKIEANEYKDYILGFMFYKFLSNKEVMTLKSMGLSNEDIKSDVNEENGRLKSVLQEKNGYFISYSNLFSTWIEMRNDFNISNVRDALSAFSRLINNTHKKVYDGIFKTLETGLSKLGDTSDSQTKAVKDLIYLIDDIPMDNNQDYDILGFIYEYLISNFAANAGKKAGEFYTPHEVSLLMSEIIAEHLKDRKQIEIYDPTSGSGSLLINIGKTASKYIKEENKIKYFAQELKQNTYNLTRMNLVMRGIIPDNIYTRNGDTLEDDWPYFDEKQAYQPLFVDAVVSNPPYSQNWDSTDKEADARFKEYGLAPKSKADYAFLLHDLYHLKSDGIMTIVLPHGVLFRGGEEGEIRKNLIEHNNIDIIIGLPANIFFGTGIPTIIMILRKDRENTDTLIIDASKGFIKEGKNNKLRSSDIKKIVDTVIDRQSIEKFSKVVTREEIRNNDYNLNIPRYVDSSEEIEKYDIYSIMNGGIPSEELIKFDEYFKVFPNLKDELFKKVNDSYYELNVDDLHEFIFNHNDIKNYQNIYKEQFENFDEYLNDELIKNMDLVDISEEETKIANALFNRIENLPLANKYTSYQILDDIWNDISGDLEIIITEGIEACNKIDPIMEVKKKGNKETEVQVGVKGRIIPLELVIDYKLSNLKDNITEKENKLFEIESRISEIFDSLTEEEKLEIDSALTDDNDAFIPKEIVKKAKEFLKNELMEGSIEKKVIEVNNLYDEQKKLNKQVKDGNEAIEIEAQKEIENLTYEEICELLNQKWIEPIIKGIDKQINDIISDFSKQIEKLSNKYNQTLVDIDEEIKESKKQLSEMINELTGSEFDMKGLEDFKSLLNGD